MCKGRNDKHQFILQYLLHTGVPSWLENSIAELQVLRVCLDYLMCKCFWLLLIYLEETWESSRCIYNSSDMHHPVNASQRRLFSKLPFRQAISRSCSTFFETKSFESVSTYVLVSVENNTYVSMLYFSVLHISNFTCWIAIVGNKCISASHGEDRRSAINQPCCYLSWQCHSAKRGSSELLSWYFHSKIATLNLWFWSTWELMSMVFHLSELV